MCIESSVPVCQTICHQQKLFHLIASDKTQSISFESAKSRIDALFLIKGYWVECLGKSPEA